MTTGPLKTRLGRICRDGAFGKIRQVRFRLSPSIVRFLEDPEKHTQMTDIVNTRSFTSVHIM